jgi:hypothetical protein
MIMRQKFALLAVLLVLAATHARSEAAPATQPATEFMRFTENADGSARLELADVAYRNSDGAVVHLIGAVHVAEREFYDGLNESFRHYDALLYEMVKSRGMQMPARGAKPSSGASGSWIGTLQRFMKDRLKLSYQLDGIDYHAKNFVHADLDWETFSQLQEDRGESFLTLAIRAAAHGMASSASGKQPPVGEMDGFAMLAAFMSPDSARELKLLLARQFANADDELAAIEGDKGSVILAERNKAAFKVLDEQVAQGKKFLGVFYGAGHLQLMEQMLIDRGYRKVDTAWRTAWDIGPAPKTPATKTSLK